MSTVQKNNNITRAAVQALLEDNQKLLELNDKELKKIIKSVRSIKITKTMRGIFYQEILKRIDNKKENNGSYHRLTMSDRIAIEVLYSAGFKQALIATFIGKHRANIKRELEKNAIEIWNINSTKSPYKNSGQENIIYYSAEKGQKTADENKIKNRKKSKLDKYSKLKYAVVGLLKEGYSPDVISNWSKECELKEAETTIGANAIYDAVHKNKYGLGINDLPHKRRYYKKQKNTHTLTKEVSEKKKDISIEVMPDEIKNKQVDTHFEGDSIIGKAKGSNNTLISLVNVASQFYILERSENKTGDATLEVMNKLEHEIPELDKIMKTLLLDNGTEFSNFDDLMKSVNNEEIKRFQIYFAHPYASYERGSNENKNRMTRRYFPKGTLIERLSDEDILNIARKINNLPRKALGYKTPLQLFEARLKVKRIDTKFLDKYRIEKSKYLVA